jgi:hypothetical protein
MSRRRIALAIAFGLACFALGVLAARSPSAPKAPPVEPKIAIDPASINLLPDASLHLSLPPDFDAGP